MPPKNEGKKHQRAGRHEAPSEENKNYSTSEAIISLRDELKDQAETNRNQSNRKHKPSKLEIGTFALVVITTALLFVQDAILYNSDTTFKDTLANQKQSNERQLRAYVGIIAGDVEDLGVPGKQRIKFTRKNFGLTPAYDVGWSQVGISVIVPNAAIPTGPGGCGVPIVAGQFTMFPTTELPWTITLAKGPEIKPESARAVTDLLDPALVQLIKAGSRRLVYWGTVCYRDTFGKIHFTNYCWIYSGSSMAARDADGCLQHNDSD
jgi:hypothetical protein